MLYTCTCVCVYACISVYMCVLCTCVFVYMYVCAYVCVCVYAYVRFIQEQSQQVCKGGHQLGRMFYALKGNHYCVECGEVGQKGKLDSSVGYCESQVKWGDTSKG